MMSRLNFTDLPADAVEMLKPLTHGDFTFLGIDAHRIRDEEERAALPSDPEEAAKGAFSAMRAKAAVTFDEPLETALAFTTIIRMAFSHGLTEDLDRHDCGALWHLANLTDDLLRSVEESRRKASRHLRAVTHPIKN